MNAKAGVLTAVRKGQVALRDTEIEEPGPGQIQVRPRVSLVSPGTERAIILALENTQQTFPQALGYSAAGFVEKVGPDTIRFRVGDRVACFGCPHGQLGNVGERHAIPIPADLAFEQAAFLALGVICLQGVRKASIELGESVLVLGLGPVGLLALQLARANGGVPTIGADRVQSRLDRAQRMGADLVFDTSDPAWRETARAATGGNGPHVVIESTGFPEPVAAALEAARRFGRVVLLGSTRGQSCVNLYATVHVKGLAVVGAHVMANPVAESRPGSWTWRDDAQAFLSLLARGRVAVDPLVTERVPWQRAPEAYDRILRWDPDAMIILIDWR